MQPITEFLNTHSVQIWKEGKRQIPLIEMHDNLLKALAFARRCGSLRVGLEQIQTILKAEETGLALMKKLKSETTSKNLENLPLPISRLLFVSQDGSERFYRHLETLLNQYSHRLLGIKINVSAQVLGQLFYGKEKSVKAVLVTKKNAVLRVLSSIL